MPYVRGRSVDFGRDILWLWKQAGSLQPTNLRVNSEAVSGRVVLNKPRELKLAHKFESSALVPAFTPSWNTTVHAGPIDQTSFTPRFSVPGPAKAATIDYALIRGTGAPVDADARTYTITHNLNDATAVVLVSTNWNTTVARVSKTANTLIVNFSAAAPSDGSGIIYYSEQKSRDDDDIYDTESVAAGARTHTIVHDAGITNLPMFFLPNWHTTVFFQDRRENQTTVRFSNPAPASAELDYKIKLVTVY